MEKYGGNPRCIIAEPEIHVVNVVEDLDLVMIGSDGIFDKITTQEVVQVIFDEARSATNESMKSNKNQL